MPIHFRKRFTIIPGVRLNLNKRGGSLTLGPRGTSINIGPQGGHFNASLKGTGLSYRAKLWGKKKQVPAQRQLVTTKLLTPIAPIEHRYDALPPILQPPPVMRNIAEVTTPSTDTAKHYRFGPISIIYGTLSMMTLILTILISIGNWGMFPIAFLALWIPLSALAGIAWVITYLTRRIAKAVAR